MSFSKAIIGYMITLSTYYSHTLLRLVKTHTSVNELLGDHGHALQNTLHANHLTITPFLYILPIIKTPPLMSFSFFFVFGGVMMGKDRKE